MCNPAVSIGITGGIGSGKSYLCRALERSGVPVFYCDAEARAEMLGNASLRAALCSLVSPSVYTSDGFLNKPLLRSFLQASPQNAAQLDALVHPCVRQRWRHWAAARGGGLVLMECALLFETGFDSEVDYKVLVTADIDVRLARVMERDGVDEATARKWMAMQMPEASKAALADFIINNDGTADPLAQFRTFMQELPI